jgi:glucose dehydrogenase
MHHRTHSWLVGLLAGAVIGLPPAAAQQARSGAWTLNGKEGEWTMTGRDYSLQRFSPLKQITTANVATRATRSS